MSNKNQNQFERLVFWKLIFMSSFVWLFLNLLNGTPVLTPFCLDKTIIELKMRQTLTKKSNNTYCFFLYQILFVDNRPLKIFLEFAIHNPKIRNKEIICFFGGFFLRTSNPNLPENSKDFQPLGNTAIYRLLHYACLL